MKEIKISEIEGIKIGHASNEEAGTGCTVIICEKGASAGIDVRGSAPASRETELLDPIKAVDIVHAIMLSGGSAFGLDASAGAMEYLENKKIGFDVGVTVVPIVCGASLFDLAVGDHKVRPDKKMGYEACVNADKNEEVEEGNVGVGTGACIGKLLGLETAMKGGLGTYAVQIGDVKVGAIVAVNALGDVFDADTGEQLGGILSEDKTSLASTEQKMYDEIYKGRNVFTGNTTIGCIITNVKATKPEAKKMAEMAQNGFIRVIRPVNTSADGDSAFAMCTGEVEASLDAVGTLASYVMSKAVNRAIVKSKGAYGLKGHGDFTK